MIKVVERKTNEVFAAKRIEGGYEVFYITDEGKLGEHYKKLKESTFKKFFRATGETWVERKESKEQEVTGASREETDELSEEKIKLKKKKVENKKPEEKVKEPTEKLTEDKKERIIEKIKKMRALSANNPSQEEAMAAALQAQKLMAKYNIHEEDISYEEIKGEIDSIVSEQKHNSHLRSWRKQLALIVGRNFRCKAYLVNGKDVAFRGYKEDAQIAMEVYLMLYETGNKLGRKNRKDKLEQTGSGKGAHNSFIVGYLKGIEDGFNGQCTELMLITPKEVEEEWEEFSKNCKTTKSRLSVNDSELYRKGYEEGKSVVKARALKGK